MYLIKFVKQIIGDISIFREKLVINVLKSIAIENILTFVCHA